MRLRQIEIPLLECSCEMCIDQSEDCMRILLANLPKDAIDLQDKNGDTALSLAAESQNNKCAQLLLSNGANYSKM